MSIQVGEMIAVKTEDLTAEDIKQIEIALVNTAATFTTFDNRVLFCRWCLFKGFKVCIHI